MSIDGEHHRWDAMAQAESRWISANPVNVEAGLADLQRRVQKWRRRSWYAWTLTAAAFAAAALWTIIDTLH